LRRFVLGVDFSDRSARAEDQALLLAARAGAALSAVHIIDGDLPERLTEAAIEEARDRSAGLAARGRAAGVACQLTTARGEPHVELHNVARGLGADLIILGAHRISAQRNAFIGTTADRILRASRDPVLVVRSAEPQEYRNALAAIDIFAPDFQPLSSALDLGLFGAEHATAAFGVETDAMRRLKLQAASLEAVSAAFSIDEPALRAEAARLLAAAGLAGIRIVLKPLLFNAADFVIGTAVETGVDLLVLGSRRKDAEHRQPLGSVSETVLRRANIDVLVVPTA
jgi:nucleotide-binding universal stress UspA family protein